MCSMELDSDIKHHAISSDVATYQSQLLGDAGGHVSIFDGLCHVSGNLLGSALFTNSFVYQQSHITFCGIY